MLKNLLICVLVAALCVVGYLVWIYRGAVSSLPVSEKVVALTYDDGPNPPHTGALLALLEARGVKATFFPKARNVEAYPHALRAVARAGHEIGNHSYSHQPMTGLSQQAMLDEIDRADNVLAEVLGYPPTLFRPPYGLHGVGLWRALRTRDRLSVLMSANGYDWELRSGREIADHVMKDIQPGAIVLLHDGHGDVDDPAEQDSRAATVLATGLLIDELRAMGYEFVTVSELFDRARRVAEGG